MSCSFRFLSSFNRPNLKYTLLSKKGKSVTKEIVTLIKAKFPRDSGIVYCLSRKECDTVASDLSSAGIKALAYHAGLTDPQRSRVQGEWISDKIKVSLKVELSYCYMTDWKKKIWCCHFVQYSAISI